MGLLPHLPPTPAPATMTAPLASGTAPSPPAGVAAEWLTLSADGAAPLRCWWARPAAEGPGAAVLVLPEVFGVNGWVRSVAERLAAEGYGALAMPIFARTAPGFETGYDAAGLALGREHRDAVSAADLLDDARRAIAWLQQQPGLEGRPVGCVGFCFGGHLALIAATLPVVAATCDFYGARVSSFRPGGGPATLALLPQLQGDLLCFCGDQDPLMPPAELAAIEAALAAAQHPQAERRLIVARGAGHGYMCEARSDFNPEASRAGWAEMLALFQRSLASP
jgi:carboxymethylenebutenolidase